VTVTIVDIIGTAVDGVIRAGGEIIIAIMAMVTGFTTSPLHRHVTGIMITTGVKDPHQDIGMKAHLLAGMKVRLQADGNAHKRLVF